MKQAQEQLGRLLKGMEVPKRRINPDNPVNLRWLSRNIAIAGKGHPDLKTAQELIKSLLKNFGK